MVNSGKGYLRWIVGIIVINICLIGGYVLFHQIDVDADTARELFLTGEYDEYIEYVSPKVTDQSLKYWRILSLINIGNIELARKELIQLDFSFQSPIALTLLNILSDISKGSYSTVWPHIKNLPRGMNIRERAAINQLYLFSLLKMEKKQLRNMNTTLSELRNTSSKSPFTRLMSAAVAYENKKYNNAHEQFQRYLPLSVYGSPFFDLYAAKAAGRVDSLLGVVAIQEIKNTGSGVYAIAEKDLEYHLAGNYFKAGMYDKTQEILDDVQLAGGSARVIELLKLQGKSLIQLGDIDQAWDIYVDLLDRKRNDFSLIVQLIELIPFADANRVDSFNEYTALRTADFSKSQLMTLYKKYAEIGDVSRSQDFFDYLLATYPTYSPALFVVKKEFVDAYVKSILLSKNTEVSGDGLSLIDTDDTNDTSDLSEDASVSFAQEQQAQKELSEDELYEKFGYDAQVNLIIGVQRYLDGKTSEAFRYAQLFDPLISDKELSLYAFFFYFTFDQVKAQEYFINILIPSGYFSQFDLDLLQLRLTQATGDVEAYTQLSYDLELYRTSADISSSGLRSGDRKGTLLRAFDTRYQTYENFWPRFFVTSQE